MRDQQDNEDRKDEDEADNEIFVRELLYEFCGFEEDDDETSNTLQGIS